MNTPANAEESQAIQFTAGQILLLARQLPCKDAAKLLRGFLLVADAEQFPELRGLYRILHACDAQLDMLVAQPLALAA